MGYVTSLVIGMNFAQSVLSVLTAQIAITVPIVRMTIRALVVIPELVKNGQVIKGKRSHCGTVRPALTAPIAETVATRGRHGPTLHYPMGLQL